MNPFRVNNDNNGDFLALVCNVAQAEIQWKIMDEKRDLYSISSPHYGGCQRMSRHEETHSDRRAMLKGVSAGVIGLSLMSRTTTANQATNLRISVAAGEGDPWTERDVITDRFSAKIDIYGLSSGDSNVAYMVVPTGPERNFNPDLVQSSAVEVDWSSGWITTGSATWDPSGLPGGIGVWPDGEYHLFATVAEAERENFGMAVSEPFEIRT